MVLKMKNEIILCGTNHVDLKGSERLKKILEKEKPEIITLECAEEYLKDELKLRKYIESKKLILKYSTRRMEFTPFNQSEIVKMDRNTISQFLSSINFEISTIKEYCEKNNAKLICIEKKELVDKVSKELHKDIKKGVLWRFKTIPKEIFELSEKQFQEIIDGHYRDLDNREIGKEDPTKLIDRNKHMVNEIQKIKGKKILHVSGAGHIFGKSQTMYEMLKEKGKSVRRIKLIEADKI